MTRYRQRSKTLDVYAPCCGAKMTVEYDGTGDRWERSTDIPARCPKGHSLVNGFEVEAYDVQDALNAFADNRAINGVGDIDERDLCGHDKAER
jgi:hypothetical protein